eukprot:CAMPEP_0174249828 /NCGR_PEP_ID=MMETSP0439-20130205/159_1 /TAXON_ID=0 /ORGANISM="Stereomyxa ramosa, Strain Chinc5" /LENGTH=845 /DNA_ID=CAMNT_0015329741 /DNA_START=94 /DNA_END=2628 /DNA_ORIENTATION=-
MLGRFVLPPPPEIPQEFYQGNEGHPQVEETEEEPDVDDLQPQNEDYEEDGTDSPMGNPGEVQTVTDSPDTPHKDTLTDKYSNKASQILEEDVPVAKPPKIIDLELEAHDQKKTEQINLAESCVQDVAESCVQAVDVSDVENLMATTVTEKVKLSSEEQQTPVLVDAPTALSTTQQSETDTSTEEPQTNSPSKKHQEVTSPDSPQTPVLVAAPTTPSTTQQSETDTPTEEPQTNSPPEKHQEEVTSLAEKNITKLRERKKSSPKKPRRRKTKGAKGRSAHDSDSILIGESNLTESVSMILSPKVKKDLNTSRSGTTIEKKKMAKLPKDVKAKSKGRKHSSLAKVRPRVQERPFEKGSMFFSSTGELSSHNNFKHSHIIGENRRSKSLDPVFVPQLREEVQRHNSDVAGNLETHSFQGGVRGKDKFPGIGIPGISGRDTSTLRADKKRKYATLFRERPSPPEKKRTIIFEGGKSMQCSLSDGIDRTDWIQRLTTSHPYIQDFRERIYPVNRAITFCQTYNLLNDISGVEDEFEIDEHKALQLILQHLEYEGFNATAEVLSKEADVEQNFNHDLKDSRLVTLLKIGLRETEKIWELTMAQNREQSEVDEELEEHLTDLEILEEEPAGKGINIWFEGSDGTISFSEKHENCIHAATLNKLVEHLTSEKHIDMTYKRAFLMTYKTFTTPENLLTKLIERYFVPSTRKPSNMTAEEWRQTVVHPIQLRVVNVIRKWVEDFTEQELSNTRLLKRLRGFLENVLLPDGHSNLVTNLNNLLLRKFSQRDNQGTLTTSSSAVFGKPPDPKIPRRVFSPSLDIMDIHDEELARQLTLLEFQTFANIKPSELLNQVW